MTDHARVVIIGGGAVGCSTLYHLAKLGWTDCLLLEMNELSSGSTWHAAGNVPNFSTSWNIIKLQRHSSKLYTRLGDEVDYPINYHVTGSIRLANNKERMDEYRHVAAMAHAQGIEFEVIGANDIKDKYPFMEMDGIIGGLYDPFDGDIDPSQLVQAYAKGAKDLGCRIQRFTRVTALERAGDEWLVKTDKGDIRCEIVVNAAGYRAGEIMAMVGQYMPIISMSHQYLVTEMIPELEARKEKLPLLRDPDVSYYLRQERHGLLLGPYEWQATPHWLEGIPEDFAYQLWPDSLDRLETYIEKAIERVPLLGTAGIQRVINGPIPYSADGDFVMGKAPELDNYFVAAGFLYGIAAGGGAGRMMAEWILEGRPSLNLWPLDIRRFGFHHATRHFMYPRAVELYGGHYKFSFPAKEHETQRGIRRSPLYEALRAHGAIFGSRGGWERANWFAPKGIEAKDRPDFDRAKTNWFEAVGAEHKAVRERVALIDQTSFSKFELIGPGVVPFLQRIAVSNMDRPVGSVIYTQLCNERGGIECDLTFTRLAADRYYFVTGAAFGKHDAHWIESQLRRDGSVHLVDVTSSRAVINLCGPRSRDVLSQVAEEDVSNAAFPFATMREITVGAAPVRAIRIGYVGELGWELHVPTEYAAHVYELLRAAGEAHGIADVGYRAIDSLRLEKGYLYWSSDITPDYTPLEAGLGFRVNFNKGDFIGRGALLKQKEAGVKQRLVTFLLDEYLPLYGSEAVMADGKVVGVTTGGNFGYTIGKAIGYGYLPVELIERGQVEIEAFGKASRATMSTRAAYDPENQRLKA
ncbi:MAG TPA: sarcosine dehydrogenase [Verrucomicrobiales bacterium]|nr:sarcosine dehydrogenase [Verrucomicrobiales bacterium]